MKGKRYLLFAVTALVGAIIGFSLGSTVFAGGWEPGSASDPLVARSYVDEQVQNYIKELEERISALNTRTLELEKELANLQAGSGTTTPADTTPTGQVVFIKEDNSYVNLRSGPGTNHETVGRVLPGEPLVVIGQDNDWYQVRLSDGQVAWIAAWLVTVPSYK